MTSEESTTLFTFAIVMLMLAPVKIPESKTLLVRLPIADCFQPCQVLWSRHHFRHLFRKEIAKIRDGLVDDILGNIDVKLKLSTQTWFHGRQKTLRVPAAKVQGIYSLLNIFLSAICFWLVSLFVIPLCNKSQCYKGISYQSVENTLWLSDSLTLWLSLTLQLFDSSNSLF